MGEVRKEGGKEGDMQDGREKKGNGVQKNVERRKKTEQTEEGYKE